MKKLYSTAILLLMMLTTALTSKASVTLPYLNPCEDLSTVAGTTPNGSNEWNVNSGAFRVNAINNSTQSDASVFFPEVDFKVGKFYRIKITARVQYNRTPAGKMRVFLATKDENTFAYDGDAIGEVDNIARTSAEFVFSYIPTENKTRYVAVNNNSPGTCGLFYLYEFSIEELTLAAPSAVTDLSVLPYDATGLKQASISFKSPTTAISGAELTNNFGVKVYASDLLINTIENLTPGQEVNYIQDLRQIGTYTIKVVTFNSEGNGEEVSTTITVGENYPGADWTRDYTNGAEYKVLATYADGSATISWKPVAGNDVAYIVKRFPDGGDIAVNTRETTATDSNLATDAPLFYYYLVQAVVDGTTSDIGYSNGLSINNNVTYDINFLSTETIMDYTIYDGNKDNDKWDYNPLRDGLVCHDNDDWLITPGFKLKAGKYYKLTVNTKTLFAPVGIEVKYGTSNTIEGMTQEALPFYWERDVATNVHSGYFGIDQDANYFIGVHGYNPGDDTSFNSIILPRLCLEEVPADLPIAVENLELTFNKEDPTKAVISFNAPTKGVSGEALSGLTKIEIYKNDELFNTIPNPTPGQQFSIDITLINTKQDIYRVVPFNESGEGIANEISATIINPPYEQLFSGKDALAGYTIIDGGDDAYTWELYNNTMRCSNGSTTDEWLITPPIHLEGGQYYKTFFLTYLYRGNSYTDNIELKLGSAPTAEGMTESIVDKYTVTGQGVTNAVLLKNYFTVAETGEYYLGFHATSDYDGSLNPLVMDNFNISSAISPNVPGATQNLKTTPDYNGGLNGVVTFTAPTLTISGTQLTEITKVKLYVDGIITKELDATPGEEISIDVTVGEEGAHLFSVICDNNYGTGREAENTAYFGVNRPSYPLNVVANDINDDGLVTITWETPTTDYDGYPINPEFITYQVFSYDSSAGETEIANNLTGNSYTFRAVEEGSPQAYMRFGVRAWTSFGGSPGVISKYTAAGPAYELPITESFGDYTPYMVFRQESIDGSGFSSWGYTNEDELGVGPVDNDNGFALFEAVFAGTSSGLITGKIKLNVEHPVLTFYVYNFKSTDYNYLNIQITPKDNINWKIIKDQEIYLWAMNEAGWQKVVVDLSEYAGQTVYVAFVGEAVSHSYIHLDCLKFKNADEQDLSLMNIYVPDEATPGTDYNIDVVVKNNGNAELSSDFTITLYRNDEEIGTLQGSAIPKGEKKVYTFTDNIPVIMADVDGSEVSYRAVVMCADDVDFDDNYKGDKVVKFYNNPFPEVTNLSAVATNEGNGAIVSWDAPEIPSAPSTKTDDIESYTSFSTMRDHIGDWKMIDADNQPIAGFKSIELPNIAITSYQAFFVMDFSLQDFVDFNATQDVIRYAAHSGNKCFAAMSLYSQPDQSDDWLISPLLTGAAQDISFYAKSIISSYPETFEVLYSTTGKNQEDFTLLATAENIADEYTLYTYSLPEGAKYFAIRHHTIRGFLFLVDDITFTPAGNERLTVSGYNVYLDGESKAKSLNQTTFNDDNLSTGTHTYAVSVAYNLGESNMQTTLVNVSGMSELLSSEPAAYGATGCVKVVNVAGLNIKVYAADGKQIASTTGKDITTIPCAPGIYIVKSADKTWKVAVK